MSAGAPAPDPRPQLPERPLRVAILGCGTIAQQAHLPAYAAYGFPVAGVWSRRPETTRTVRERFPFVERVYGSAEELLADPGVDVVDIATGPAGRMRWVAAAVEAGKHVLAQKPLTDDAADLALLDDVLAEAGRRGVQVAVNQNGQWAPAWRLATLLLRQGAVGEVVGVTHLFDKPLPPLAGTPFDDVEHMLVSDYLMHWIDISRCWLEGHPPAWVMAHDARVPGQPDAARNPWSAQVHIGCEDGASASMRIVGDVRTGQPSCPFWVHGTAGTLRGSVLNDSDRLELDRPGETGPVGYPLAGRWFVDGFAGTMSELMCAVGQGRQPENSAARVAASVRLMLAARESARSGGAMVRLGGATGATGAEGRP